MRLIPIDRFGKPMATLPPLTDEATAACQAQVTLYNAGGYMPPWTGYLARSGPACVGSCGFRSPPVHGRVEIACVVFAGYEGHGFATQMTRALVELAQRADPAVTVFAQHEQRDGAWPAILRKLGFVLVNAHSAAADGGYEYQLPPLSRSLYRTA